MGTRSSPKGLLLWLPILHPFEKVLLLESYDKNTANLLKVTLVKDIGTTNNCESVKEDAPCPSRYNVKPSCLLTLTGCSFKFVSF